MRSIRFLLAFLILAIPAVAFGQIGIRVAIGPPALPLYDQPDCPGDGYLWTPGYWAYDDSISDYYWVPGTWVEPPEAGFLWTPGYWGWADGGFLFNDGYWGPTVGFYGGINYGYGYWGGGYGGGRWDHGHFFYNSSVNNLHGGDFHNTYNERISVGIDSHVSFNGGNGGVEARPTREQETTAGQRHTPAVAAQTQHAAAARSNPEQRAGVNHGKPAVTATSRPGEVANHGEAGARNAAEPARAGAEAHDTRTPVHPNDLAPISRPAAVNSGNAKADTKYEQQQDKLISKQTQERQQLQAKQDSEHKQNARASSPKLEQKHQQQTQQMAQRHTAQQQQLQSRAPQAHSSGAAPRK